MERELLSVSDLNEYIKHQLENDFSLANVFVRGEICNLNKHYTGHYYFSLKDEDSKISCMMFSNFVKKLTFDLKNGDEVIILGHVSVYEKNGTYQIYARSIEPFGQGKELLKLKLLKEKLQKEGLFDLEKQPIPKFPKTIGIISSKSGAAVRDLIHTIQSRWNPKIYVFPCLVQGEYAPKSIIEQLDECLKYDIDTVIISRGGGANEDLSAFNDEELVRKVVSFPKPIISAVGHQIDNSLIDLVSDASCITPTEAGIKATPNKDELYNNIISYQEYLFSLINRNIDSYRTKLLQINSSKALIPPLEKLKLQLKHIEELIFRSNTQINRIIYDKNNLIKNYSDRLKILNPYSYLEKGYSLVRDKNNNIINSINDIEINDKLTLVLLDGEVEVEVKRKKK